MAKEINDPAPKIFKKLNGREYRNYAELREAIIREFNMEVDKFPMGYTYLQFMDWAYFDEKCIIRQGKGYKIQYPPLR